MEHPPVGHDAAHPAAHAAAAHKERWSDSKVDTLAVLVVFVAVLLAAVHFAAGGAGS